MYTFPLEPLEPTSNGQYLLWIELSYLVVT